MNTLHVAYHFMAPKGSHGFGDCVVGEVPQCPQDPAAAGEWLKILKGRLIDDLAAKDYVKGATVVIIAWQIV